MSRQRTLPFGVMTFALRNTLTWVFLACLSTGFSGLFAQQDSIPNDEAFEQVIQISGMIVTGDSLHPLPYATVYRARDERGTMTDARGFFSIPALAGDSIRISSVGYISMEFTVPLDMEIPRLSVVQSMSRDTITLSDAFVYPWPTRDRFREDFLALEIEQDAYGIGQKRLDPMQIYDRLFEVGQDAGESYSQAMREQSDAAYTQGQLPTISLLNPIAWAQFIQALRSGSLKR